MKYYNVALFFKFMMHPFHPGYRGIKLWKVNCHVHLHIHNSAIAGLSILLLQRWEENNYWDVYEISQCLFFLATILWFGLSKGNFVKSWVWSSSNNDNLKVVQIQFLQDSSLGVFSVTMVLLTTSSILSVHMECSLLIHCTADIDLVILREWFLPTTPCCFIIHVDTKWHWVLLSLILLS